MQLAHRDPHRDVVAMSTEAAHSYQQFLTSASHFFQVCDKITAECGLTQRAALENAHFAATFLNGMAPGEQAQVMSDFYCHMGRRGVFSESTVAPNPLFWLRGGTGHVDDQGTLRSGCVIQDGQAILDVGRLYTHAADRANHALKLVKEIGGRTDSLNDQINTPLYFCYHLYAMFGALYGVEGEHAHIARQLAWIQTTLDKGTGTAGNAGGGFMGLMDSDKDPATAFLTPVLSLFEKLITKSSQDGTLPPVVAGLSTAFMEQINSRKGSEDPLTNIASSLQGVMASPQGKEMLASVDGALGTHNPAIKGWFNRMASANNMDEASEILTAAINEPQTLDEVQQTFSTALGTMFGARTPGGGGVSPEVARANQAAASAQPGEDFQMLS